MTDKQWAVRRWATGSGDSVAVVEFIGGAVVALMKHCGGRKEANARLIAAAPDLLAVAIKSHEPYVGLTDADVIDLYGGGEAALCLALRAAIAKATGA